MNRVISVVFTIAFLSLVVKGFSATYTASVTGNWSNSATWGGGGTPGASDNIVINTGITVTMDAAYSTTGSCTLNGTGTIQMAGYNLTIGSLTAAGAAVINNGGANATLTEGSANAASTYTGAITGDINISKSGTATLSIQGGTALTSTSSITVNGTGNLELGRTVTSSYAGDVTFTLSSTGSIYVAYTSGLTNTFSGNIVVNCTSTGTLYFGRNGSGGSTALASGKTISVGGSGFTYGTLSLYNFTQTGATAQTITLGDSASVKFGSGTTFNGNITATAPKVFLNGSTFNGTAYFELTGTGASSSGGNTFNGATTIVNSGTYNVYFGNTSADTYNSTATFTNTTSSYRLDVGNIASSNVFNDNIYVNNTGGGTIRFGYGGGSATLANGKTISVGLLGFTDGELMLQNFTQTGSTAQSITLTGTAAIRFLTGTTFNGNLTVTAPNVLLSGSTFNGTTVIEQNGSSNSTPAGGCTFNGATTITVSGSGYLKTGAGSADIFNGQVTFTSSGTGNIFVAYNSSGNQFNNNVIINSIGSSGVLFCYGSGTATLANGKTITAGTFSSGALQLINFTQTGATAQTLTGTGTAKIIFDLGTTFNGNLTATAPQIYLNGTTFNGTATLEKNGATSNAGTGGNTFNSTTTLTNSGSGYFMLGNGSADVFNGDVTITNTGTNHIYLAYATATSSFNGNIVVNSTSTSHIRFGSNGGLATLANGKTITVGGTGFSAGSLYLANFTQIGATAQSLTFTGTGILVFDAGSTFNANVTATAPTLYLNGTTFNGTATLEKNGSAGNTSTGGNTFNNTFTITNSGSGSMVLSGTPAFTMGAAGSVVCSASKTLNITGTIVNGGYNLTGNVGSSGTCTYSGVISGTGGLIKTGSGTLTISAANSYTGVTTLTAGTLALGASGVIADASNVVMNGGTFSSGGYSETMGTLTLNANSIIALGSGSHSLNFSASNGTSWTGGTLLKVTGWQGGFNGTSGTSGKIYTGSSAELSVSKVAQVFFMNPTNSMPYTATQLSDGEIVPTSTLPVELISFEAEKENSSVVLKWITASEINSEYFEIYRSSDNVNFEVIGKISAAGNSHQILNYTLEDTNPLNGVNYYKLVEYDFDGTKQEFKVVSVSFEKNMEAITQFYPNPTSGKTSLYFNSLYGGIYYLKITNLLGKEYYSAMVGASQGENKFDVDFRDFPEATYIITMYNSANQSSVIKVLKKG